MIDMTTEAVLPLGQAAKFVPSLRPGKPTHVATLVRWITVGSKGVRLEALRLGGKWVTSREALQRFAEAVTAASGRTGPGLVGGASTTPTKAAERADRQLATMGL